MRKILPVLLVLFSWVATAQRANQTYRVTTEVSQYIFGNFPFTVEKIFGKRGTLGLEAGIRFATKNSGTFENKDFFTTSQNDNLFDYTCQNTFNRFYNAYTLGIQTKLYFKEHRTFYLEPYFMYRYWWFNEKEVRFVHETDPDGFDIGYTYDGVRSEVQRDYVFGFNFGRTIQLKQTRKSRYVIDFEVGLGIIDRAYEFTTLRGEVNGIPVEDYTERGFGKHPRINLGLSIGLER